MINTGLFKCKRIIYWLLELNAKLNEIGFKLSQEGKDLIEQVYSSQGIENLNYQNFPVQTKLEHGHEDMRKVMSKPFNIENLYYAKHEPVDEATLNEFNQSTGNNVDRAYITPLDSDYAHDMMTTTILAYVLLDDVKVRRDKYKPETEEGRKLLAHELTHVAQNQNKEFVDHRTREELEEEAEANERTAESIQDPLVTRKIHGKDVVLPASKWHEVSEYVFRKLRRWIHYEKFIRPPEEYELLVKKYECWMKYKSRKYRW